MYKAFQGYLIVALLAVLTSCNPDPADEAKKNKSSSINVIRVSMSDTPQSIDPRKVRDVISVNISHMLFEGLFRTDYYRKVDFGVAKSVEVSDDNKVYTFTLKDAKWSNGEPITASDFEYSWKSLLDPNFPAPNAYQLFVVKGAREAKQGKASLDAVGVRAVDDKTLVVELEAPCPYFSELLTTHFFACVNRQSTVDNKATDPLSMVTNGPFKIESLAHGHEMVVVKNPFYWDVGNVHLEKIILMVLNDHTALQMFERGELDWAGSPMGTIPPDAIATLKAENKLNILPAAGVHWFRLNTEAPPFNNTNFRRALALAVNRKALVDHITQANQQPATGIVPLLFGLQTLPYFVDNDITRAWEVFQDSLREMSLSRDDLPQLTLCFTPSERNIKVAQAVQQQWKKVLGLNVTLEVNEGAVFFDRISHHNYQMSMGSWCGDIKDATNFLEVFKFKEGSTNNTQWENPAYVELLDQSSQELDPAKRLLLLCKAERLIVDEMPVIPLYYTTFNYVKNSKVRGVRVSELGYLDFTHVYIANDESE